MKIVAVTACPTGIAHTYMAAEQLEKTARRLGHWIKVETQGAMGIETELSPGEIAGADLVVFAADIAVQKGERFVGLKVIEVPVQEAIRHPEAVFNRPRK
jgi:fructose-specific phosphotransferase system IIB component